MFGIVVIFLVLFAAKTEVILCDRLSEPERVAAWYTRNVWPPNWQLESALYSANMAERERELMIIPGADERWENWMQYTQARMLPRFTEKGFQVVQTPPAVYAKLRAAVQQTIDSGFEELREEMSVEDSIYGPYNPKFVDLHGLEWEVINELRSIHEEWAGGMKLRPTSAYGVRLYRNGSSMVMHNDKPQTHVISSIVHLVHEYDDPNVPWPIEIEDHDGTLTAVSLEEGQMLFYESASCLHGRMTTLRGKYYGSLFLHYQPVDKKIWDYTIDDVIANVPPHWKDGVVEEHGSRWAGQAITVDSRVVAGAPPRESMPDHPGAHSDRDPEDGEEQDFYRDLPADEL